MLGAAGSGEGEALVDLAHLSETAWAVLEDLATARLMSTDQIRRRRYASKTPAWVRAELGALRKRGLVDRRARRRVAPPGGYEVTQARARTNLSYVWYATEAGVAALEGLPDGPRGLKAIAPAKADVRTQAHALGVSEVGVLLTEAAGDPRLVTWTPEKIHSYRGGAVLARTFVRADALISVEVGAPGEALAQPILLELDRGTASLISYSRSPGVLDKVDSYLNYRRARTGQSWVWAEHYPVRTLEDHPTRGYPYVWWVIDMPEPEASERRDQIMRMLPGHLAARPPEDDELRVVISTLDDVRRLGPLGGHGLDLRGRWVNFLGVPTERVQIPTPVVASVLTDRYTEGSPDA